MTASVAPGLAERPAADGADVLLELRDEAPSSVQWPELWTRGAISLTRRRCGRPVGRDEHLDGEHADMVERLGDGLGDRRASAASAGGMRAGTVEVFRM